MLDGIDVSEYQPANIGDIVAYDFLISKGTEGTGYVNPYHTSQVQSALSRGKCAGLYHYARAGTVQAEVDAFARVFEPYAGRAVPFLDWEGSALAAGPGWRQGWLDAASRTLGIRPALYGSLSVIGDVQGETLWIAAYGSNPVTYGYQTPKDVGGVMRQYTSQGRLPGYSGNLDLNKFWGSAADWQAHAGSAPAPKRKKQSVFVYIKPADGNGSIYIRNTLNGKEVGIQGMQHLGILERYTNAQEAVEPLLQAEIDICEWYLNQIR